jgi:hypothetical protein
MTLAPNVTDLDESNLPHYKPHSKAAATITTDARVNNANNVSENAAAHHDDEEFDPQNLRDKEFNLINEKLKQLKLTNDSDKYNQLVELKKRLLMEEQRPSSQQQQQNLNLKRSKSIDLNELKEVLKMITGHLNDDQSDKTAAGVKRNGSNNAHNQSGVHDETSLFSAGQNHRSTGLSSLNDEFKRALTDLDQKLCDFESLVGKQRNFAKKATALAYNSSYTLSLIQIVSTLLDYLKEATVELNYEKLKQAEMNKQLDIHRKLIDGLTTEVLCVKEQNERIVGECLGQSARMENELDQIKIYLRASMLRQPASSTG